MIYALGINYGVAKGANMVRSGLNRLLVARRVGGAPHEGRLIAGTLAIPCALGRTGPTSDKREGDGATPRGERRLLYALSDPVGCPWRAPRSF